jgi:hypothetical protein
MSKFVENTLNVISIVADIFDYIIAEMAHPELWLISAPGDKTCQQTWEQMNNLTHKQEKLSTNFKFHVPDLKVLSRYNYCYFINCFY